MVRQILFIPTKTALDCYCLVNLFCQFCGSYIGGKAFIDNLTDNRKMYNLRLILSYSRGYILHTAMCKAACLNELTNR